MAERSGERYSIWSLLKHAMGGHKGWERAWRDPEPKKSYDVIIVGGGGHGLATAYYLAKNHGIKNIAVLEKGHIGVGQRRAQHHHRALQLHDAREHALLRAQHGAVARACPRT